MTTNDTCPVCLSDYTTSENHKPVVLKCGHVFGTQCIKQWFGNSKSALCPTCAKSCRLNDLRYIFATSIKCIDATKEKEIMDKYLEQKNKADKLQNEVTMLKTTIDLLRSELTKMERCAVTTALHIQQSFKYEEVHRIPLKSMHSICACDGTNGTVFISSRDVKSVGYLRVESNRQEMKYVSIFKRVPDGCFISDMKMSPFKDNIMMICYSNEIKLLNTLSNNVLVSINTDEKIKTATFGRTSMDDLFIADVKGHLYVYSLKELRFLGKVKIDNALHSLHMISGMLFVGCLNSWYSVTFKFLDFQVEDLNLNNNLKCIYISGDSNYLIVTSRENKVEGNEKFAVKTNSTMHKIYNINDGIIQEVKTIQNGKEIGRHRNKIFKECAFVVDENKHSIYMHKLRDGKKYKIFDECVKVIDFDLYENGMLVLSERELIFFECEFMH